MATDEFRSNALVSVDFQLSGGSLGVETPTHIYIIRDGFRQDVRIAIQRHGAEPSPLHQATMPARELIAFGELCVTLGELFLGDG